MATQKKERWATAKGTETILVVDDEPMLRKVNREILELLGYRVYEAEGAAEAIALFRERKGEIDLVILDMIMPGISGSEAFDLLRKMDPGIKVLLSSGSNAGDQAQKLLSRGGNGFLQKPFPLAELAGKVREMLDQRDSE